MGVAPSHDEIPPRPNDPSSGKEETQIPHNSAKILKPALKEETELPHNCNKILRLADSPVDRSSMKKLYQQLYAGVYLNQKTMKYWVDRESKSNCFTLFPRGLEINFGVDTRSWQWLPWKDPSTGESFEIAKMLGCVCVEIHGRLEMAYLTPGTNYVVAFGAKLTDSARGWEEPVDFQLAFPNGTAQVYPVRLGTFPREQWVVHRTLPFKASGMVGAMQASIQQHMLAWREGLVIKWIIIRPIST